MRDGDLMGWAQRAYRAVTRSFSELINPRQWGLATLNLGTDDKLREPYREVAWVYACVRAITRPLAHLPRRFYTGTVEEPQFKTGEADTLFLYPNARQDGVQFAEAVYANLLLNGNCMVALERTAPNVLPEAMYVTGPSKWQPEFGQNGQVQSWQLTGSDGAKKKIETFQVIHLSLFSPYDDFWGQGPLTAAFTAAESDWLAERFNSAYFRNGGDAGGILRTEQTLRPDVRERMVKAWEAKHAGGTKTQHKIALLEGGVEYESFKTSHKDMEFPELRRMSREQICACFHVPPIMIGVFDAVYKAVDQVMKRDFWSETLIPLKALVESSFNRHLLGPTAGVSVLWDTSNVEALRENETEKADIVKKYFDMGVPFNDLNKRFKLGFQDYAWGDTGFLPIGLVSAEDAGTLPEDLSDQGDDESIPTTPTTEPSKPTKGQQVRRPVFTPHQFHMWETRELVRQPIERLFGESVKAYLNRVKTWMGQRLDSAESHGEPGDLPKDFFDLAKHFDADLRKLAARYYRKLAQRLGPQIEANIRRAGRSGFVFEVTRPEVVDFLKAKEIKIVSQVNQHGIREAMRDVLTQAKVEGVSMVELRERIYARLRDSRARADTIARTETGQAANGVQYECDVAAGIKEQQWVAAKDEVTRDSHLENMELGPWPLGKKYPNGCLYPCDVKGPAGEVINCRCSIMAVR